MNGGNLSTIGLVVDQIRPGGPEGNRTPNLFHAMEAR